MHSATASSCAGTTPATTSTSTAFATRASSPARRSRSKGSRCSTGRVRPWAVAVRRVVRCGSSPRCRQPRPSCRPTCRSQRARPCAQRSTRTADSVTTSMFASTRLATAQTSFPAATRSPTAATAPPSRRRSARPRARPSRWTTTDSTPTGSRTGDIPTTRRATDRIRLIATISTASSTVTSTKRRPAPQLRMSSMDSRTHSGSTPSSGTAPPLTAT